MTNNPAICVYLTAAQQLSYEVEITGMTLANEFRDYFRLNIWNMPENPYVSSYSDTLSATGARKNKNAEYKFKPLK